MTTASATASRRRTARLVWVPDATGVGVVLVPRSQLARVRRRLRAAGAPWLPDRTGLGVVPNDR